MSDCGDSLTPRACSGLMYAGVPNTVRRVCCASGESIFATEKSSTFTKSPDPFISTRKTLSGLISRWIMPWLCASCRLAIPVR